MVRMDQKILRIEEPFKCLIVERVNRFVVKISVNAKLYRAYINNTGRLLEYLDEGREGFCVKTRETGRTDCRLFSVKDDGLGAVIDTQLQMKVFEKALEMQMVPWIYRCKIQRRNAKLGESLIDYLMDCTGRNIYLEVKSAVLREGEYAMYPDRPSVRGRRHIKELTDHVKREGQGIILFIAALPRVKAFKPNRAADPEFHELLRGAQENGVDVKSIGLHYNPDDSFVYLFSPALRVNL